MNVTFYPGSWGVDYVVTPPINFFDFKIPPVRREREKKNRKETPSRIFSRKYLTIKTLLWSILYIITNLLNYSRTLGT